MVEKNQLKQKLEEIDRLFGQLSEESNFDQEIDEMQRWLINKLDRINLMKLKYNDSFHQQEDDDHFWQDGLMLINSSFKIICCSGIRNFLPGSIFSSSSVLSLVDLVDSKDHKIFISVFEEAKRTRENKEISLHIETKYGQLSLCTFSFDMKSSHIENDRFLVHLNFEETMDLQFLDYQTIVFDNLPDMDVFLFDEKYRYILAGGKEKERYGKNNADYIGKTMFEVLDKKSQRSVFPFYNKAIHGEYTEGEVRYGEDVYYIVANPVKDFQGKTVAGILIAQNVTTDKLLEEQLKQSKDEAQKANKAKSIFIANMSHEMRTPLNAIIGFTEQLEKTSVDMQQRHYLSLVKKASDHLLYLVSEVVFLFKLGMGKVYLEQIPFSLTDLIDEVHDFIGPQTQAKNLDFNVIKLGKIPSVLLGDPFRLRQILLNLLGNALKYTEEGEIVLSCRMIAENDDRVTLFFQVSDTGIGISEQDLPFIFKVFEQGNKRTERIRGGAGLGLGICSQLVSLLDGEIGVDSEPGLGSTFWVKLPMQKTNQSVADKKDKCTYSLADNFLEGKKILLADDDMHNLMLAELLLKNWKTNYHLVSNGKEALKQLKLKDFDVILLDIQMPGKDGVDVVKSLLSDPNCPNRNTPKLAVTANVVKADIQKYLKVGFDDYVLKPYREIDLYNKVCNVLGIVGGHLKSDENTEESSRNKQENNSEEHFDSTELKQIAAGNSEFYDKMMTNFFDSSSLLLRVFELGMTEKNWKEIGEKAHKAIPVFRFFKLKQIASHLELIEKLSLRDKNYTEFPDLIERTSCLIKKIREEAFLECRRDK